MGKLIFALFVLVVGLGVYGAIRRRPNLLPGGFIIDPGAQEILKANTATHNAAEVLLKRRSSRTRSSRRSRPI